MGDVLSCCPQERAWIGTIVGVALRRDQDKRDFESRRKAAPTMEKTFAKYSQLD